MGTATNVSLVGAAQAGDERALAALLAEALPLVYGVVGKALRGGPDVDDVVQETMLRVVRSLSDLQHPDRFRAWVISIAYRQLQDRGRSMRAATALGPLIEDASDWPDPGADFVDSTMFRLHMAGERREANEASHWLSASDQRVLALWWQEAAGLVTRADLARALGLSVAHAAVRVQRAKARLVRARTVLRAWHAVPGCARLQSVADQLGGPSDPRWFRGVARHVRGCDRCAAHEQNLIPPEHLLAGGSLAPVIAGLVGSAGATGAAGAKGTATWGLWDLLHRAIRYLTAKPLLVGGAAAVGASAVLVYAVYYPPYEEGDASLGAPPAATAQPAPSAPASSATSAPSPTPAPTGDVSGVTSASFYVSPGGSDTNSGSLDEPFATLSKAVEVVRPGQTIALRGGVYRPTESVEISTSGTAGRRIVLSNYRDERPVIDASGLPPEASAVTQRASYWTVQGLEIAHAPGHGYLCRSCRYGVFRLLSIHDNGRTGLMLRDENTIGNQVVDSDLFANHDAGGDGEFADGLGIEYGSGGGNVVRGCRLYENSDDGLGLHEFTSPVTIDATWSFANGVNRWDIADFNGDGYGFKLGGGEEAVPVDHVITNSAAWDNATYGFTESGNTGSLTVRNNTAFRNGRTGFAFTGSVSVLRRNLAIDNARDVALGGGTDSSDNSWDQSGWSGAVLVTTDQASARAARSPDGRLPRTRFLTNTKDPEVGASMAPA